MTQESSLSVYLFQRKSCSNHLGFVGPHVRTVRKMQEGGVRQRWATHDLSPESTILQRAVPHQHPSLSVHGRLQEIFSTDSPPPDNHP